MVKDPLFELIHRLEPSEKAYYKRFSRKSESKSSAKYFALFETISRLKEYDEEKLLKKLKGKISKKDLATSRNYLYQDILNALYQFDRSKDMNSMLHEQCAQAQILLNRGLYSQSLKLIDRVKKKALKAGKRNVLFRLIGIEDEAAHQSSDLGRVEYLVEESIPLVEDGLQEFLSYHEIRKLVIKNYLFQKKENPSEEDIAAQEAVIKETQKIAERDGHFRARNMACYLLGAHYTLTGDMHTSLTYRRLHYQLYVDDPSQKSRWRKTFIRVLNNYINGLFLIGDWQNARELILNFQNAETNSPDEERELKIRETMTLLILWSKFPESFEQDHFGQVYSLWTENEAFVQHLDAPSAWYYISWILFNRSDLDKALQSLSDIEQREKVAPLYKQEADNLFVLIHLLEGDFEFAESFVVNKHRRKEAFSHDDELGERIYKFLYHWSKKLAMPEKQDLLQQFEAAGEQGKGNSALFSWLRRQS